MSYNIPKSTLKNFIWLNDGAAFERPAGLEIEILNPGEFRVEAIDIAGNLAGEATRANKHGGWHTFNFQHGGEFGPGLGKGSFKIKLISVKGVALTVRGGTLEYGPA